MDKKEKDSKYFLKTLIDASAKIEEHYFQLPIKGRKNPRFLERVYCYELYHKLRSTLCDEFQVKYKLNGEVDKNGNPAIRHELGPKKPDFIIHVPRDDNNNLVVLEVKPISAILYRIKDDIKKLKDFLEKANYHQAIMLMYGSSSNKSENKLNNIKKEIDNFSKYSGRIILLWHKKAGEPAIVR